MGLSKEQQITALQNQCTALIESSVGEGVDEDCLYQAQVNIAQGFMWLKLALGASLTAPEPAPQEPALDTTPPTDCGGQVLPREHGGVMYWWRWRSRTWVPFCELPEDSQVCAMDNGYTVS